MVSPERGNMIELKGKTAIVTGAASGIGPSIAEAAFDRAEAWETTR